MRAGIEISLKLVNWIRGALQILADNLVFIGKVQGVRFERTDPFGTRS